ncbi:MAG: 50S ribosomal protein L5 [Candidatus Nanoarchaeia archaeon]
MNKMKEIRVEKVTLNVGAGKDQKVLEKGVKLLTNLTGTAPIKTITNKRLQAWGLRPGLPVGCKLTLRGEAAEKLIPRLIHAKDNILTKECFDNHGNISFGLPEYMDIKDAKYDPEIGMMGLQASITLTRPGFRIKNRKIRPTRISSKHQIKQEESINFMKEKYSVKIGEKE